MSTTHLDRPEEISIEERAITRLEHMLATNPDPATYDQLPTQVAVEHAMLDDEWSKTPTLPRTQADEYIGCDFGYTRHTPAHEFLEAWRATVNVEADAIISRIQEVLVDVFSTTALPIDVDGSLTWPGLEGAHEIISHMIRRSRLPLRPTNEQIDQLAEYFYDGPTEEHWERIIASSGR